MRASTVRLVAWIVGVFLVGVALHRLFGINGSVLAGLDGLATGLVILVIRRDEFVRHVRSEVERARREKGRR